MILKNLLRRKGRTLLTVFGIGIGVMTIIALGALANGLKAGYSAVLGGTKADFVITDPNSADIILNSIDESVATDVAAMPEVEAVSPMLQGLVRTDKNPYFFVFAYPQGAFPLERFHVVQGVDLYSSEAQYAHGRPALLGSAAADSLKKGVGDSVQIGDSTYRVVGIYETGETFEEGGALLRFDDAQALLGRPNQVSLIYIRLKEPSLADRFRQRFERLYPQLSLTTGQALANQNLMSGTLEATVWGVAALAIIIGGVSMMNAQLMAVLERTREIGVLRAVGWKSWRVLVMILGESVLVGLLGGVIGAALAWLVLRASADQLSAYGATSTLQPGLLLRAFVVVFVLGLVGGLYPAIRAARLQPVEALRYEGGTMGRHAARLPLAGLALQNLWQRKGRTGLTLAVIAISIGAIMVLNAIMTGFTAEMSQMFGGAQIVVRQAEAADLSVAFIDQRVGQRIAALPGVQQVSGTLLTALMNEQVGIFMLLGDEPRSVPMQSFNVVEGQAVTGSGQIMIGQQYAEANHIRIGDTVTLGDVRFRVVGIYTHPVSFYELGGVTTLRDVQSFMGKPRKVTFFSVVVSNPAQAKAMVDKINAEFPEVHASLSGEFASQLPDMQNANAMVGAVALIAILVGGVGVMNTMLMAVLERTREIGVLRALGWRRRAILGLILRESLALGVIGAALAVAVAFAFAALFNAIPDYGAVMDYSWSVGVFAQALGAAVGLGVVGGLYPAFRATRLQPVEALRYE